MKDAGVVRRLAAAGALTCLVIAGLAVAAHPGRGTTWLLIVVSVVAAAVLVPSALALLLRSPVRVKVVRERGTVDVPWHLLVVAAVCALLAWALESLPLGKPKPLSLPPPPRAVPGAHQSLPPRSPGRHLDLGPWVALALGLLVLAVVLAVWVQQVRERKRVAAVETVPVTVDALALAVEAALLDLENEDDPRRAVIKAYASTEAVLREHGLPRLPAEAPLEYLDRVLRGLGARAGAVDRLTELFEHAAFSTHDVDGTMRAEAVSVFHGLRDTLVADGAS